MTNEKIKNLFNQLNLKEYYNQLNNFEKEYFISYLFDLYYIDLILINNKYEHFLKKHIEKMYKSEYEETIILKNIKNYLRKNKMKKILKK